MKKVKAVIGAALALSSLLAGGANAAPVNWNWGGYTQIADTPVIGGYAKHLHYETISGGFCGMGCTPKSINYVTAGVVAFGMVAYNSLGSSGAWYGGSYTAKSDFDVACPANTADISVLAPYQRADGPGFNPYVYAPNVRYAGYSGAYPTRVTLCVKTDTYP